MTNQELLNIKIKSFNHDNDLTVKGYLRLLLTNLWDKGESFSSKRPFGDSGWEYDLYIPLILSGAIKGEIDQYGDILSFDTVAANGLVFTLIDECFK